MNLDTLIDQIAIESAWLSNGESPNSDRYRKQVAVALVARVPLVLSSAIYSSLLAGGTPPKGLENTLGAGAGICGHHVQLSIAVLQALSIPVRDIQVFYRDSVRALNHTVIEMEWGGMWRMIDVTWGFVPHHGSLDSALSYEEAAGTGHREGLHHTVIPWRLAVESEYDIFGYLTPKPDALLYDGSGSARLIVDEGPMDLPHNRVYRAGHWHHRPGVDGQGVLTFEIPQGNWRIAVQGNSTSPGTLVAGAARLPLEAGEVRLEMTVAGSRGLDIGFEPETAYGHLELLAVTGHPASGPVVESHVELRPAAAF